MHTLNQILTPRRTVCRVAAASKKRLFESIATIVAADQAALDYGDVLDKLVERENLGSTGLGKGIALPHCRVQACTAPLGALLTLAEPLSFDAPDEQPVDLLFVLLVPQEAHQQHLDILADIAGLLSQADYCADLRAARDDRALFAAATRVRED